MSLTITTADFTGLLGDTIPFAFPDVVVRRDGITVDSYSHD